MISPDDRAVIAIRVKLLRAHQQLSALDEGINDFQERHPYGLSIGQADADGLKYPLYLHYFEPIPVIWSVMAGEIVHNLRSALEQTIYQLSVDHGGHIEGTGFPAYANAVDYAATSVKHPLGTARSGLYKIRGVGSGVRAFVERAQPYHFRNPADSPLLELLEMWNQDKHRLVHLWGITLDAAETTFSIEGPGIGNYTLLPSEAVLHEGAVAATVVFDIPPLHGQVRVTGNVSAFVAVTNPTPGATQDQPARPWWSLYDYTSGLVGLLLSALGRQDDPLP